LRFGPKNEVMVRNNWKGIDLVKIAVVSTTMRGLVDAVDRAYDCATREQEKVV
jgi:hypothetical protein